MLNHSSATERKETSHANRSTRQEAGAGSRSRKTTISNALRRRAQAVIKDRSIDAQSRAIIRYALLTNDPWLPELVRRADAGETIIYTVNSLKRPRPAKMIQAKKRLKH